MKESESEVAQSCLTLCDPMDCSLPGFSIHGIFQARVLEWVAISFSRGSFRPRDQTRVSHIAGRHIAIWATREAQCCLSSVQFIRSVVSDSLRPHESQHARPPCPSPTPGVHPNSCASGRWCNPACVDHNKLWKFLPEMGIPDHLICLLRNQVKKQQLELDMEQQTGSK